jgi:hypothetical protein
MVKATAQDVDNLFMEYLGRPADPDGSDFYSGKDIKQVAADLAYAAATGVEDKAANQAITARGGWDFAPPPPAPATTQSEADIRRQVEADVAKFVAARDAGESTAGIGRPLDRSQFIAPITPEIARDLMGRARTEGVSKAEFDKYGGYDAVKAAEPPITSEIAADLIGRSQTGGVSNLEFDRYGGYQAVKDVYNASGGSYAPPRPSVDATNTSLTTPSTQLERNPFFQTYTPRSDVNYDELFTARSLDQGGTAPTAESINEAFETFYNRPADMPGVQGYLNSGKSIEQIRADLAYSALYSPELGLSKDVEYYEAPSATQLQYIQNLGGGAPTSTREDTFSYVEPSVITADEVRQIYTNQFGYEPTQQDIEYWTNIYPMSPAARMAGNSKQQTINAMLVGSDLPQYQYLETDTDLSGTRGQAPIYTGTPMNPTQLANQQDSDYRGAAPTQPTNPFGGFFGDENFNPFDYTGIAPTPGMYRGYDPFADQRAAEINMLGNQYLGGNLEPQGMEFYSTQRSTGRSLADIAADLSASPEGQAFAQTGAPSPERAAISSNPFFAFRTPTEVAAEINMLGNQYLGGNFEPQGLEFYSNQRSTGRSLADIAADLSASPEGQAFAQTGAPSPERAAISSNPFNQGIVAALPGSTASTT